MNKTGCHPRAERSLRLRFSLLAFVFCLLPLEEALRAQAGPGEDPAKLISLLASKNRTVPKRAILERLLDNRKANLPEVRRAAREGEQRGAPYRQSNMRRQ